MFKTKKTNFERVKHLIIGMLALFLLVTIAIGDDGQQGIVLDADDNTDVTQMDEGAKEVNIPEGAA